MVKKNGNEESHEKDRCHVQDFRWRTSCCISGKLMKSKGGLKKEAFTKSKTGKIVSKKASANGKKIYAKYLLKWNKAVAAARKAMGVKGFQAVGGKSAKGQALLKKARSLYKK